MPHKKKKMSISAKHFALKQQAGWEGGAELDVKHLTPTVSIWVQL